MVKNLLVPASVDFSRSPRADAGYPGVLQVRIDIDAIRAFAGWPKPATVNLVLKKMPLSAVIEIDGSFVRPRCAYPIVRHQLFLAEHTVDEPVSINSYRIMAADRLTDDTKVLEN
ncbi:MAG: hypothetical protein WA406_00780, partial [Pseudolabrys sp.]